MLETLKRAAQEQGFRFSVLKSSSPRLHRRRDDPIAQELWRNYRETVDNHTAVKPFVMSGGCYVGKLPNALGYGPGIALKRPDTFLPSGHGGAHGPDECVHIDSVLALISTYVQAIVGIDRMDLRNKSI